MESVECGPELVRCERLLIADNVSSNLKYCGSEFMNCDVSVDEYC